MFMTKTDKNWPWQKKSGLKKAVSHNSVDKNPVEIFCYGH